MIDISLPKDLKPDPATIGNSGMIFDSLDEAMSYSWKEIKDEGSNWYGMRFGDGELPIKMVFQLGNGQLISTKQVLFLFCNYSGRVKSLMKCVQIRAPDKNRRDSSRRYHFW
ncbi:hypothetical protein ACK4CS_11870 [Enterococcus gallinarum]|uniref:Uncharacterized protein n=1 Tax=Enterococcus gallinarum TaxID=1353 RepID=A0A376GXD4_ENTGA|nr:hypothetical protein [Enterococcus gallinarum]MDT2687798.1 hypothetical protein [Enterococcus gallinarum]OJG49243.1 hypothetical protein RV03_GL000220 [Enterococcus gallinarum]STD82060.1 Uncharacterised protein [Enterococcus gallinarum]STE01348.1 Uncharacterised protein [Enterococcus gallinarum]